MRYGKLTLKELDEVVKLYIKERDSFAELISIEEYCEKYLRQCECCGKIVSVDEPEDDIYEGVNTVTGKHFKCCEECYKDLDEDEKVSEVDDRPKKHKSL